MCKAHLNNLQIDLGGSSDAWDVLEGQLPKQSADFKQQVNTKSGSIDRRSDYPMDIYSSCETYQSIDTSQIVKEQANERNF